MKQLNAPKSLRIGAASVTIGNIAYLFAQWLITFLVARLSDFQNAGILSLAITTANIFFAIGGYGLRAYQVADVGGEFTPAQYVLHRLQTTVASVLLCLGYVAIMGYDSYSVTAIALYMIYKTIEAFTDVLYGELQRADRLELTGVSMLVKGVASLAAFVLGLLLLKDLNLSILLMTAAVLVLTVVMDARYVRRYAPSSFAFARGDFAKAAKLWWNGRHVLMMALIPMVMVAIPRVIYEGISTELFGIYSSIATPTILISTFISCLLMPLVPTISLAFAKRDFTRFSRYVWIINGAIVAFGAVCWLLGRLLGDWVLTLLFGAKVHPYTDVFGWVIIQVVCASLASCENLLAAAMHRTSYASAGAFVGLAVTAALSRFAITSWDMTGISVSLGAGQFIESALVLALLARHLRKARASFSA